MESGVGNPITVTVDASGAFRVAKIPRSPACCNCSASTVAVGETSIAVSELRVLKLGDSSVRAKQAMSIIDGATRGASISTGCCCCLPSTVAAVGDTSVRVSELTVSGLGTSSVRAKQAMSIIDGAARGPSISTGCCCSPSMEMIGTMSVGITGLRVIGPLGICSGAERVKILKQVNESMGGASPKVGKV